MNRLEGRIRSCSIASVLIFLLSVPAFSGEFRFTHHVVEQWTKDDAGRWGQTALADMDHDGDLDFLMARGSGGEILLYEFVAPDRWIRHQIGDKSPSDVGGAVTDLDGDGWADVVLGGAWLRNPGKPTDQPWPRHTFDPQLGGVHDVILADVDGDRKVEAITMSDRNDLRWYDIPSDPTKPWTHTVVGKPVHAGVAAGDLDGDGDVDIVRSTSWFENQERGTRWVEHRLHEGPWPDIPGGYRDATRSAVVDINRDGRQDVALTVAEVVDARIAWFEAPAKPRSEPWRMHLLPQSDEKRGPYHSLAVADFDNDGDLDIFSGEMESIAGARPPRWFVWENTSGKGEFTEHIILDKNLGTHEAVVGDVDGDGDPDIVGKPWRAAPTNAAGGRNHVDYLENLMKSKK